MDVDLTRLFKPESIAILGASPVKVPGRFNHTEWLHSSGFSGSIYPVNPGYKEVKGLVCYPALKDIPGEIDIVIMTLPAEKNIEVLRELPSGKVKFAIVITSGYSEIGEIQLEQDLLEVARLRGIRIVGPNCMSIYSRKGKLLQLPDQTFGSDPGEIAGVGQSGGNSVNLVRSSNNSGVTVNCSVSIGNQCDLSIEDFLEWYDQDDDIKVITGYIEGLKFGPKFLDIVKRISPRKPIILWKGGTTPQGSQAAASHTGSLAVTNKLWEGLTRQTGIIPAVNIHDTINSSRALLWETLPQGPGVCLMSPGGGCSVSMTDASINEGLEVPVLSQPIRSELSSLIAKVNTIIDNPIDFGASSYLPQTIKDTIIAVSKDPNIHSFIFYHFIYPYPGVGPREISSEIIKALKDARQSINKPIYVAFYSLFGDIPIVDEARREVIQTLNNLRIPYTVDLESCVKTVSRMWGYSRFLKNKKADLQS
ncbi:MAG: hypothetical protein HN737_11040 [Desulfobacterales bacterium]|nr:hypothetical protein [Desulfobacterales bacterium]